MKQPKECEASKIVIRDCDRNKETIPPRNENTTTTNDNINNNHNIDNRKNYQTTTTTTTITKRSLSKFLFNPILLFSTVSYDFIVAPDITYSIFFSLLFHQSAI